MNFRLRKTKYLLLLIAVFFLCVATPAIANNQGEIATFNLEKNFDASERSQISGLLVKTTENIYFYVDKTWWDSQPQIRQNDVLIKFDALASEFKNRIYPILTSVYGSEANPGVDNDPRLTILFHPMTSTEGGYFREADGYVKLQITTSNEREMMYISTDSIDKPALKAIVAHEFVHIISFNQKVRKSNQEEETWLEEARADYSSNILGYDDVYQGSTLQSRVQDFIQNPSDSVTEWRQTRTDYAAVSLFTHYLVDHYGINILTDSLKSGYIGVESIDYALQKVGFKEDFAQIFTNWTVALAVGDCSINQRYCYLNQNLKNFRLAPSLNFLPLTGNVSLAVTNFSKNWQGTWLKFIGGNGNLTLDFSGPKGLTYQVPYILEDSSGSIKVSFLKLTADAKGTITIPKFGKEYKSLIIIPSLQSYAYRSDDLETQYPFSYTIKVEGLDTSASNQELVQELLNKIAQLQQEIARLQGQQGQGSQASCKQITTNLAIGLKNNEAVKCLQSFLKSQGNAIYPEGYITGNFGELTKQAVVRFQEKYVADILTPVGLTRGTGYVGSQTRIKINQLLSIL